MASLPKLADSALKSRLPQFLKERVRIVSKSNSASSTNDSILNANSHVLYWMRPVALRAHENPALDCAIFVANELRVPLKILLHVEDEYNNSTARRQMFLLQGAREVVKEILDDRFAEYLSENADGSIDFNKNFELKVAVDRKNTTDKDDESADGFRLLNDLVDSASVVITEEPFCNPFLKGVENLSKRINFLKNSSEFWLVDTACVVSAALVAPNHCNRAYQYENGTKREHDLRIGRGYEELSLISVETRSTTNISENNKFLDLRKLTDSDFQSLIKEMKTDHSIAPVSHITEGGATAGYKRWNNFLNSNGLKTYAARRNDSLDVTGVSRMSPYLNAGMVSPMRLARDVSRAPNSGGKGKFLNEFLTWRGLSYGWCYHHAKMNSEKCTVDSLPTWAKNTLQMHANDHRPELKSLNQLKSGSTGDRGWDGMQRYLVESGELHNNARMGWGCAIVKWTANPQQAIDVLLHLNDSYSLDGHSPCSYGGLLGCLGLFTGPKGNSSIYGSVGIRGVKGKYSAMPSRVRELTSIVSVLENQNSTGNNTTFQNSTYPGFNAPARTNGAKSKPENGGRNLSAVFGKKRENSKVDNGAVVDRSINGTSKNHTSRNNNNVLKNPDVIDLTNLESSDSSPEKPPQKRQKWKRNAEIEVDMKV